MLVEILYRICEAVAMKIQERAERFVDAVSATDDNHPNALFT